MIDLRNATGADVRKAARRGEWTGPTAGLARGFVQANLVLVPRDLAYDFLLFCQRNPKPCPLLDVTEPGSPEPCWAAPGGDVYTDAPRYCVYRHGERVDEPADLLPHRRDDLVGFLLGCSFTFEYALLEAGVPVRHIEQGCNVPMYRTNIACRPAGVFHGPMVVSMRPMAPAQAVAAVRSLHALPAVARHAHPLRRSGGDWHPRSHSTGFRRSGGAASWGDAGVLGVRRDAAGGGDGGPAVAADDA